MALAAFALIGAPLLPLGCRPSPAHTHTAPPPRLSQPGPCGQAETQAIIRGPVLASAALLQAKVVVVGPRPGRPTCVVLRPGTTISLRTGDRAEFVANRVLQVSPPSTRAVAISTAPGPAAPGGLGGVPTPHVIVTLTAAEPGVVSIRWIDCNGTGC